MRSPEHEAALQQLDPKSVVAQYTAVVEEARHRWEAGERDFVLDLPPLDGPSARVMLSGLGRYLDHVEWEHYLDWENFKLDIGTPRGQARARYRAKIREEQTQESP